jgi:DNA invertase Pin-like site-specific DNA recombinase
VKIKGQNIAAIYCRVSTSQQLDGDGIRRQRAGCEKWCKDNGLFPVVSFVEAGTDFRHKDKLLARQAAVAFCREHNCLLVVEAMDRLTRQFFAPECDVHLVYENMRLTQNAMAFVMAIAGGIQEGRANLHYKKAA